MVPDVAALGLHQAALTPTLSPRPLQNTALLFSRGTGPGATCSLTGSSRIYTGCLWTTAFTSDYRRHGTRLTGARQRWQVGHLDRVPPQFPSSTYVRGHHSGSTRLRFVCRLATDDGADPADRGGSVVGA